MKLQDRRDFDIGNMSRRHSIPKKIEKLLFQEVGSRCPMCGQTDISTLTIHHIEQYASNLVHHPSTMIVLCANCHAKADRGEIGKEILYDIKKKANIASPKSPAISKINVKGVANVVGENVHIGGDVRINVHTGRKRLAKPVIPGSVSEDVRKVGYLEYLIKRYNEFKKWECESKGMEMKYFLIRQAYERELKYQVKDTPLHLFDYAVNFLKRRIANTMLGRIRNKAGERLYSDFENFDNRN